MSSDVLQKTREEILGERADVLSRAGRSLSDILDLLKNQDYQIEDRINGLRASLGADTSGPDPVSLSNINEAIHTYNKTRERARVRYYYLVVTREALGLRRHTWIEEIYRIPPKKLLLDRRNISCEG